MKERFQNKRFQNTTLNLLAYANAILEDHEKQGYVLSVRGLYYKFIAQDLFPDSWIDPAYNIKEGLDPDTKNNKKNYMNFTKMISNGRLAGLLDWSMIVDYERETISNVHWNSPADIVKSAAQQFKTDKWEDQPYHVEVMVEKKGLKGIIGPVCKKLDVNFTLNKGYSSQTMMYEIGKRLEDKVNDEDKEIVILYIGDHDPSGLDMDRDIAERLSMFSGLEVRTDRLALTWDQIEELNPPKNPAKLTDTRAKGYISLYGLSCWELEAMEAKELDRLVTEAVESLRDPDLWDDACEKENGMKAELRKFVKEYNK